MATHQVLQTFQKPYSWGSACAWDHQNKRTGQKKREGKPWIYRAEKTLCLPSSCPAETDFEKYKQAAESFLKYCWMSSSTYSIRHYSLKYNFEITLDNLSPTQMTLSLGQSISLELQYSQTQKKQHLPFFNKSTCQIYIFFFLPISIPCLMPRTNTHQSWVTHMFSRY